MRQVRLTPQALKDCDNSTRERVKEALRHLAEHPLDGKPLKGHFQKDKVWSCRVWPKLVGRALYRTTQRRLSVGRAVAPAFSGGTLKVSAKPR